MSSHPQRMLNLALIQRVCNNGGYQVSTLAFKQLIVLLCNRAIPDQTKHLTILLMETETVHFFLEFFNVSSTLVSVSDG